MYEFTVNRRLGDYVKCTEGFIYEITSISLNIVTNKISGQEEIKTFYEGVDLRDPLGQYYIIIESMATDATDEEIEEYIKDTVDPFEEVDTVDPFEYMNVEDPFKEVIEAINNQNDDAVFYVESGEIKKPNEMEMLDVNKGERTLSDVLNDYLNYKDLAIIFGDNEYESELNELLQEFEEFSSEGKENRTADDVLDDYLSYKRLVEILGCDETKYKDKMDELMKEFNAMSDIAYK